jgi:hypothetical protein
MSRPAFTSGVDTPLRVCAPGPVAQRFRTHRALAFRAAAAIAVLVVLWSYTPPADPKFRLCGFHWLTGRDCPLCGMTRALFALAKGQFPQALGFNKLSPLGFGMLFSLFWDSSLRGRIWTLGIAAFAVYGVLRIFVAGA